jgi:hypothetical protein
MRPGGTSAPASRTRLPWPSLQDPVLGKLSTPDRSTPIGKGWSSPPAVRRRRRAPVRRGCCRGLLARCDAMTQARPPGDPDNQLCCVGNSSHECGAGAAAGEEYWWPPNVGLLVVSGGLARGRGSERACHNRVPNGSSPIQASRAPLVVGSMAVRFAREHGWRRSPMFVTVACALSGGARDRRRRDSTFRAESDLIRFDGGGLDVSLLLPPSRRRASVNRLSGRRRKGGQRLRARPGRIATGDNGRVWRRTG